MRSKEDLRNSCIEKFGAVNGTKLADFMLKVSRLNFCVATGWRDNEMSISLGCDYVGRIFGVSEDYKSLIVLDYTSKMPPLEKEKIRLLDATHVGIAKYLPHRRFSEENRHCQFDKSGLKKNLE